MFADYAIERGSYDMCLLVVYQVMFFYDICLLVVYKVLVLMMNDCWLCMK